MKKFALTLAGAVLALTFTTPLPAQLDGSIDGSGGGGLSGCVSSPENPTAILALLGAGGAFAAQLRSRFKSRK